MCAEAEGYTGTMCNECKRGYGKLTKDICVKCASADYWVKAVFAVCIPCFISIISFNSALNQA